MQRYKHHLELDTIWWEKIYETV